MSDYGFVYVLENDAMHGYYKIGATRRPPTQRCAELSAPSGVPYPFEIFMYGETVDPFGLESKLHQHFGAHRASPGREFFMFGPEEIGELVSFLREECAICAYGEGYDLFVYFKKRADREVEEATEIAREKSQR